MQQSTLPGQPACILPSGLTLPLTLQLARAPCYPRRSGAASLHGTPAGRAPLLPLRSIELSEAAQVAAAAAALGPGQRYMSYAVQKLAGGGTANHAAFWLQDQRGNSHLAVIVSWPLWSPTQHAWILACRAAAYPLPADLFAILSSACCPFRLPVQGTDARHTRQFTFVTCPTLPLASWYVCCFQHAAPQTCLCRAPMPVRPATSPTSPAPPFWSATRACPRCGAPTGQRCRPGWRALAASQLWRRTMSGGSLSALV